MSADIAFDNFIVTDSKDVAEQWTKDTWQLKREWEFAGSSGVRTRTSASTSGSAQWRQPRVDRKL